MTDGVRACIVGAGFSGIAAAIELRRAGVNDLVIVDRADRVGGAWRANTYPGCACDVQSRLYELKVGPWPQWSRKFAGQREIRDYLENAVQIFGLEPYLRLDTELLTATWDEERLIWQVVTSAGDLECDVLISACGGLTEPFTPSIPGAQDFTGVQMHTAQWNHSVDLTRKRVAVVGTGASAIQVIPAIAPDVDHLVVLQRTPPWILPRRDRAIPRWYRSLLAAVPPIQRAARGLSSWAREAQLLSFTRQGAFRRMGERMARRHLQAQVPPGPLREALAPHYDMGCKRILLSDDYYPALTRGNVTVAPALDRITQTGVVDAAGAEHPVDVIVWATGFKVMDPPLADRIVGRTGVSLAQVFADSDMAAYRGTTVAGFPNLFILQGPNTGLGHSSVLLMSEAQIDYLVPAVAADVVMEVLESVQTAYVEQIDRRLATTVWQEGGCRSWYQDGHGRNIALWPGSTHEFARMMKVADPQSYVVRRKARNAEPI